ncbi:MAG TPA: hypothetical protein VGL09_20755 [Methylomirabilota bacterium]
MKFIDPVAKTMAPLGAVYAVMSAKCPELRTGEWAIRSVPAGSFPTA